MIESLLIVELAILTVVQWAWCTYYGLRFNWRATPLGPVWLAKGSALALLWPALIVNEYRPLGGLVWVAIIGPLLLSATFAWLVVTVRVRRGRVAS